MRTSTVAVLGLALAATVGGSQPNSAVSSPLAGAPPPAAVSSPASSPPAAIAPDVPSGAAAARDAELARRAAGVVDVFRNFDAAFSPDGGTIVFISDRDGLPQLYLASTARPEAAARRLITSTERVGGARFTPDGKAVLFTSDHGADENWSIFRFDLAAGQAVDLTPGEKLNRDFPFVPDGVREVMFYSARRMEDSASSLYAQPLAPGKAARRVLAETGPGFLAAVSRDGKQAAWVRVPSESENHLAIVDLATGAAKTIYPPPQPSGAGARLRITDAALSPDGRQVYVATDGGSEQALVLALDAGTGAELARYTETHPATADLAPIVMSKHGDLLALGVQAGNHFEIRILEAAMLRPAAKVELPLGSGGPSALSDDGRHLAVTWSTPSAPNDVFDVDVRTGKVSPLRREPRPGLGSLPNLDVSIAEVSAFDGLKLPINVYLPSHASGKRLPVIVSYHGGPSGTSVVGWSASARFFTSLGYA